MGALLRKNPSIGFNRKFINKLRKQMSHDSKNPTVYEERWKRLVTGMLYQSNQADIQIRIKKFVQNCRDMS